MAPPLSYGQLARKTTPFNPYIDIINQIPSNITAASLVQPPSLKVAEKLYELPKLKVTPLPKQPEIKVSSYKKYKDLRRMLDEEEKEEEKKPSIWTRIKEEQMGLKKIRQVGEFGKTILQQPQRAITSIGLETAAAILSLAKGKKVEPIFTPESKFEKFVFGEEPIVGIFERTKRAQETSENILVNYSLPCSNYCAISIICSCSLSYYSQSFGTR